MLTADWRADNTPSCAKALDAKRAIAAGRIVENRILVDFV